MFKISNDNISIRIATPEDAKIVNTWRNDGNIMKSMCFPNGTGESIETTANEIASYEKKLSKFCMIEVDGNIIGDVDFRINTENGYAGFDILIGSIDYQNKGYGTKILRLIIDHIFNDEEINKTVQVHTIDILVAKYNTSARHVYEKLGFKIDREDPPFVNHRGEIQHEVCYIFKREWHT